MTDLKAHILAILARGPKTLPAMWRAGLPAEGSHAALRQLRNERAIVLHGNTHPPHWSLAAPPAPK